MKRTVVSAQKVVEVEKKVEPISIPIPAPPKVFRWQKIGGGHLYWRNHIIKPGQVFEATKEELPKSFMDTLICLEPDKLKEEEKRIKEAATVNLVHYRVVKAPGAEGLWNVVNEAKKAINENPLEKEQAEELKAALEA
jgi:hypothetical protein